MSAPVIKVKNLAKQYRIGERENYKTFREEIVNLCRAPFRRFNGDNPQSEIGSQTSGTIWALKDVSFEVDKGEVVGIIGRNGAGKSTLLKILSKITEPTQGRIEIRGRVGSLLEVGTGFHPELTGHENIYLYGAILGMDRWEITRKFDEIVSFAEVEKFVDTPVKRYSSGMYMRLAFAVAAHLDPQVILVDEVLSVGDSNFQKKCLGKMEDMSESGRTVLLVTHNMSAVLNLCQKAILFDQGCIVKSGRVEDVIKYYLTSSIEATGEKLLSPEEGGLSDKFFFTSAKVSSPNQAVDKEISVCTGVDITLEYKTTVPLKRLTINLEIWDSEGMCIFSSTDKDKQPELLSRACKPGKYQTRCSIPKYFLKSGRYFVSISASIPRVLMLSDLPSLLSFDILDINSLSSKIGQGRRGVICPILDWKTSAL